MSYSWANMSYQEKVAQGTGAVVFVMALVFVFLILSAQYESWSLPLSVMAWNTYRRVRCHPGPVGSAIVQ